MGILCGIDEAGYGPRLGPLVVTAVVFETQSGGDESDRVRRALAAVTSDKPVGAKNGLVCCDSKKLYVGPRRLERLERNLLPFVCASDCDTLFEEACGPSRGPAVNYPWYAEQTLQIPRCGHAEEIARDAALVREGLQEEGVRLAEFAPSFLDAAEFNAEIRRTGNKADALFALVARTLSVLWQRADEQPVEVWADKQGGRNKYAPVLQRLFPEAWIMPREEGLESSTYELTQGRRRMRIRFLCRGETKHQAIALASMCSKYARELFMARFNAFWAQRIPGLKPTEGYAEDANRFLKDIEECRRRERIPDDILVRCR